MAFPLTCLPREIVVCQILPLLERQDAIHLAIVLKLGTSRQMYEVLFGENRPPIEYNDRLFEERSQCVLYLFDEECTNSTPKAIYKVDTLGTILQISGNEHSVQALNLEGQLYTMSDDEDDGMSIVQLEGRERLPEDFDFDEIFGAIRRTRSFFDRSPSSKTQFCSSEATPQYILAVDESGIVWSWEIRAGLRKRTHKFVSGAIGGRLHRFSATKDAFSAVKGRVTRIRATKSGTAFEVEGVGIAVGLENRTWDPPCDGFRKGYPCYDGHMLTLQTAIVPNRRIKTRDFVMTGGYLVCLQEDGRIRVTVTKTFTWRYPDRSSLIESTLNKWAPFADISHSAHLILLCTDGTIVIGSKPPHRYGYASPIVISYFRTRRVHSVSLGLKSLFVLTEEGKLYFWPIGALYKNIVPDPQRVDLPGRVYSVHGGGKYGAALVYCDEGSEKKGRNGDEPAAKKRRL